MLDLVAGSHPGKTSKPFFNNFTQLYRCTKLSGTIDIEKVQHRNKALVETAIKELREGEKCIPIGLHSTCLSFE